MTQSTVTVNTPCAAYNEQAAHWAHIEALMGGTLSMRAAGEAYLPKFPRETDARYLTRLGEAVLYEAFPHAVETLAARPFGEPVQLGDPVNPWFAEFAEDVDAAGSDLTVFSNQLLLDILAYGRCHILPEYPNTYQLQQELGRPLSRADEQDHGLRPYWVRVDPRNVIGWRGGIVDGREQLTQLRIRSQQTEYDGEWGDSVRDYVTVWRPDEISVWAKNDDGEWALAAEPAPNTLGRIPLVTVYARREALMVSYPPMEALAWLNVKHWQQGSDQDQIEKVARVPMIVLTGFSEDEAQAVQVGPYRLIGSRSPEARAAILETSGSAVAVGREGLTALVGLMRTLSMAPMERRAGNPTATEMAIEAGRQVSDLEAYVMKLERGLSQAMVTAAEWASLSLPPPEIQINQDFGFSAALETELTELREDYRMGATPQRRYLWERRRRGLYSEDMDIDEEIAEARDEQGAALFAGGGTDATE